jgi:hypothetical protein
MSLFL